MKGEPLKANVPRSREKVTMKRLHDATKNASLIPSLSPAKSADVATERGGALATPPAKTPPAKVSVLRDLAGVQGRRPGEFLKWNLIENAPGLEDDDDDDDVELAPQRGGSAI